MFAGVSWDGGSSPSLSRPGVGAWNQPLEEGTRRARLPGGWSGLPIFGGGELEAHLPGVLGQGGLGDCGLWGRGL